MKKLFGKKKDKNKDPIPNNQQSFLAPQQNQDLRAPSPQPGAYQQPIQGYTTPWMPPPTQGQAPSPSPYPSPNAPFAGMYGYQPPYPYYGQQPQPGYSVPFAAPSTPQSPPPSSFSPEQLAMFTPEQRAQILQWSQQATPVNTPPPPLTAPPVIVPTPAPPAPSSPPSLIATPPVGPSSSTSPFAGLAPVVQASSPAPVPPIQRPSSSVSSQRQTASPPLLPPNVVSSTSATTSRVVTTPTPLSARTSSSPAAAPPPISISPSASTSTTDQETARKVESANLLKEQAANMLQKKDYSGAVTYYTLALDYTPKNAALLSGRASAYLRGKPARLNDALSDAKLATEQDPSVWEGWSILGQCLLEKNDGKGARTALENAVAIGGQNVDVKTREALEEAKRMPGSGASTAGASRSPFLRTTLAPPAAAASSSAARPPRQAAATQQDRIFDTPAADPSLPGYTPNFSSTDPAIQALSAQALVQELTVVTNHLKTKNKGAYSLKALGTGPAKALQVTYSYMTTTELTNRERGLVQPLHSAFADMWVSPTHPPGNTFLDIDMECSSLYAGKVPGTVGINGYSEEYRITKLPPRLNLMLCNSNPLPTMATDTILTRLGLIRLGLPSLGQAETELRQLLGPITRQTGFLYLTTWQTQIEDLCYALNRDDPSTFVDFSSARNVSNHTLASVGAAQQSIGLTKFLFQILLGAELFQRLLKEPVGTSYAGLVSDTVSALLVLSDQWMKNVDVVKKITHITSYTLVSRVHRRQVEGLVKFAEMIKWPYIDEARRAIENAYDELTAGQLKNLDMTDWLFGLVQPGRMFRIRVMMALVWSCASTRTYKAPSPDQLFESGLVLPSRSWWPQRSVLGRVLGGLPDTAKNSCGWIGPVIKPVGDTEGWLVVTARPVEFPDPCVANPGEDDDGLAAILNGATGASAEEALKELVNVQDWIAPSPPPVRNSDASKVELKALTFEKLPAGDQYRASLSFEIDSASVIYTLYSKPVFIAAHPCVGTHVMHQKDIQKYTKNVVKTSDLKETFTNDSELLVIDATGKNEEVIARAWCSERGRHAVVRRGTGCCYACALHLATGRRGLGVNVLIWS